MGIICFVNTAIPWGGGEKWHFEVSHYLHENGYDVLVFAHEKSVLYKKLKEKSVPVVSFNLTNWSFLDPLKYLRLKRELGKHPIQTIVLNLSRDVKVAGVCAKAVGIERIIYRRGSAIPIRNTILNRYYFGSIVTEILANSKATKATILANNKKLFARKDIKVIYNGISFVDLQSEAPSTDSVGHRPLIIKNLGRLEKQKNQIFLLYLAQELDQRKIPFRIIIGGTGRLKAPLQEKITEMGLVDKVELAGYIDEPIPFLMASDIFALPSLWEGFGYVLAEAAFCRKPAIAFNISSNPELIIDGKTGYLTPPNDVMGFADAIEKLYLNPKLMIEMGEKNHIHAKENFDKAKNLIKIRAYLVGNG